MLIPDLRYVPVLVGYEDNAFDQNNSREVHGYDPRLDFTKYSDNGVIGDLSKANIELGRRLWHWRRIHGGGDTQRRTRMRLMW